ncbi:uncharacterized protein HMPREF1541_03594 [Cyphellophora europaea CBS 101466]|uniref:Uncharacterized protein n=1 Tax=Cyphellophora europaea (strain CBS 101466) TaxID=1220924 RepID=W2S0T5_CYPE1|nr:uncharacterized protein HMPREF1541_03594 [Cyphellophora europaea CBS 101466]ETN41658.1 hypothetical protein HMPREF1541_03594 [Cyphellophora europaea CBS 101466]
MANLDPTKWPRTPELYNLLLDRKRSFQVRYKTHWLLKAPVQDGKSSQAIIVRIPHALIVLILSSVQPQCIEFEPLTREIFSWKVIKDPKRLLNITYMQNVEQTFDALPQQSAELTLKDITRFGGRYLTAFDRWWIHIPPTRT